MASQKPSRPFYEVFLERVIKNEAVQRDRAAVTDEHTREFFDAGRLPGAFGDFPWSLDARKPFPYGPIRPCHISGVPRPVSLGHAARWDAAVAAVEGVHSRARQRRTHRQRVHPATGVRSDLDPAEWARTGLVLDVRNGDLNEGWYDRPRQAYLSLVGHHAASGQANPKAKEGTRARL